MNRSFIDEVRWTPLEAGQASEVLLVDAQTGATELVLRDERNRIESPNWSRDGEHLLVNSTGSLYRIPLAEPRLDPLATPGLVDHNNDHQYSVDGHSLFTSSEGDGHLYTLPAEGGPSRRITPDREETFSSFLQGVSRDGRRLHYVGARRGPAGEPSWELHAIDVDGAHDKRLTTFGTVTIGFEESADGWCYFSSELDSLRLGTSQLYRLSSDGVRQQLTDGAESCWFPRPSPDGTCLVFLAFPPASGFHPYDVPVKILRMDLPSQRVTELLSLTGGQGTLNMSSWSPDGGRFAVVAYPRRTDPCLARPHGRDR